ncbi:hypothetical protein IMY05_006G0021300 [Salix suchowensis]|nr:hypothetical protein IMY05_006G0021300 [Salix suchowensis]
MSCNVRNHPSPLLNSHFLTRVPAYRPSMSILIIFPYTLTDETSERKYEAVRFGGNMSLVDSTHGEYRSYEHGLIISRGSN